MTRTRLPLYWRVFAVNASLLTGIAVLLIAYRRVFQGRGITVSPFDVVAEGMSTVEGDRSSFLNHLRRGPPGQASSPLRLG